MALKPCALLVQPSSPDAETIRKALHGACRGELVIVEASGAPQAVEYLNGLHFDVILVDLDCLSGDGLELLRTVRLSTPDSAVIALADSGSRGSVSAALDAGAGDYVLKSEINDGALVRSIVFAVERCRQRLVVSTLHRAQKLEAIARLSFGIAHHYRNMLQVNLWNLEQLMDKLPPDTPALRQATSAHKAAERMRILTDHLVNFCGRTQRDSATTDMNHLVRSMEEVLRSLVGEHIEVNLCLSPEVGAGPLDCIGFEQALIVLALNARDAMAGHGVLTISTQIEHSTGNFLVGSGGYRGSPLSVTISVRDEGNGLHSTAVPAMFEPFFTTKQVGAGSGMSLAAVYGMVKDWGGTIEVFQRPRSGTEFRIRLPWTAGAPSLAL